MTINFQDPSSVRPVQQEPRKVSLPAKAGFHTTVYWKANNLNPIKLPAITLSLLGVLVTRNTLCMKPQQWNTLYKTEGLSVAEISSLTSVISYMENNER